MSEVFHGLGKAALLFAVVFLALGLVLGGIIIGLKKDKKEAFRLWRARHRGDIADLGDHVIYRAFATPACIVLATICVVAVLHINALGDGELISAIKSLAHSVGLVSHEAAEDR